MENCELVQLETREDAYFNAWFTTVTDKYIGVSVEGNEPFKLFARSGKFLCNVGSVGRGPGEYTISPYDAIIDDQNELIYLAPFVGNKILVYNKHIGAICERYCCASWFEQSQNIPV